MALRRLSWPLWVGVLGWVGCAASGVRSGPAPTLGESAERGREPSPTPTAIAASEPAAASPHAVSSATGDVPGPGSSLSTTQARAYMLKLINRDRRSLGLPAVDLDEGPAMRAGQAHAEDMAHRGFLGHWGTDGSVPEQRFTEAGGADMVLENSSCYTDEKTRPIDHAPRIDPRTVERTEDMFFHELPPHDGHRKNILDPKHKKVGIGIAQPVPSPNEIAVPCFAQEFVDSYGAYGALPKNLRLGEVIHVQGALSAPAEFAGVGLARIDMPKPLEVSELNLRRSYPVPQPYETFWPQGYQTRIPVTVAGSHFRVDLPVSDRGRPGLYELSVWARFPGNTDLSMVSLRTFRVR